MAVFGFENQSGDPSLDWMGPALAAIVRTEISAALKSGPVRAANREQARAAGATAYLEGTVATERGQIRVHAVEQDAATQRHISVIDVSADAGTGVLRMADEIARKIGDRTRPFGTRNEAAVRAWGEGLAAATLDARLAALEKAVTLDPAFGEAYLTLLETQVLSGRQAEAAHTLERARARAGLFTDYDRARLELMAAELTQNRPARRTALVALTRLSTTDPAALQQLGELEYLGRRFPASVEAFRNALAIDSGNPTLLNQLGYAEALRGNLDAAREALEQYARAAPASANPLDSLGDVHFYHGRFADAERYYLQAWEKEKHPAGGALLKAAQARLLAGEVPAADALFSRYAEVRRKGGDALLPLETARWKYVTGRQKEALTTAEALARSTSGDLSAYARAHLVIWYLVAGQNGAAQDHASAAMSLAQTPQSRAIAAASRFLSQPKGSPAEWQAAADLAFGPGPSALKSNAMAYGLLLSRQFAAASPLFRSMFENTDPAYDGLPRTLYAWTLVETARKPEAAPLVERYPLPFGRGGEALFTTLQFPRFLYVRALALESLGKGSEARPALDLFRKYAGDLPSIFSPAK